MMRLTSLVLIALAAGGTFAMRLLSETSVANNWWVEGGLGFLVIASLVGLWVRAVNQNAADRIAHDLRVVQIHEHHAGVMAKERDYHHEVIDKIVKANQEELNRARDEQAATAAALLKELKERIEDLENKGSDHGGRIQAKDQ